MIPFRPLLISLLAWAAAAPEAVAFSVMRQADGASAPLLKRVAIGAEAGLKPCAAALPVLREVGLAIPDRDSGDSLPASPLFPASGLSRFVVRNPFLAFNGSHVDATPDSGWTVRVITMKPATCLP